MKLSRIHAALAAAVAALATVTTGALPAAAAVQAYYPITISGYANGQAFSESGCLHIVSPGLSSHGADFSLKGTRGNGFYGTLPGPIQFATNAGLLGTNSARLDTASVSAWSGANGSVVVDAVPVAAQASNSGNIFLATNSSIFATSQLALIHSGDVRFTLTTSRQVSGTIIVQGSAYLGYSQTYYYTASFSGTSTGAPC